MKALPSIAFNEFSGSAKDVTARVSKGRQVLSSRCMHSHVKTGAQASSRNRFSGISRAYRKLSSVQMAEWAALAEHMKGISTFGEAAKMTAHNAFVRINTNRALAGMPALTDAPVYTSDVPEVDYDDFWVTPERIIFVGLNQPSEHHRLVMKMSRTESTGVSSGWGNTVIVAPAFSPDWGDADITESYLSTIGFLPVAGQKYFLSFWWMDTQTGFTGMPSDVDVAVPVVHCNPYVDTKGHPLSIGHISNGHFTSTNPDNAGFTANEGTFLHFFAVRDGGAESSESTE